MAGTTAEASDRVIAVADSSPLVAKMLQRASRDLPIAVEWVYCHSGVILLDRLFDAGKPVPDLVLIDLDVSDPPCPLVLSQLRGHWRTRWLPLLVFGYNGRPVDVALSYSHGANAFLNKPESLNGFICLVEAVEHFWLRLALAVPPPTSHSG